MALDVLQARWDSLGEDVLTEAVDWILHREGFFDVEWVSGSGAPIAECRRTHVSPGIAIQNWTVCCLFGEARISRDGASLSQEALHDEIVEHLAAAAVQDKTVDGVILVSAGIFTQKARKALAKDLLKDPKKTELAIWGFEDLEMLLERHQDLRLRLLDIQPSTWFYFRHLSERERQFVDLDKLLELAMVRDCFEVACRVAVDASTLVTIAHLLVALLQRDQDHTRQFIEDLGLEPDEIASYLEQLLGKQTNRVDIKRIGLRLSTSFRRALDTAVIVMKVLDKEQLTQRLLLLAVLSHPKSDSIDALCGLCGKSQEYLVKQFVETMFDDMERKVLAMIFGESLESLGSQAMSLLWEDFDTDESGIAQTGFRSIPSLADRTFAG